MTSMAERWKKDPGEFKPVGKGQPGAKLPTEAEPKAPPADPLEDDLPLPPYEVALDIQKDVDLGVSVEDSDLDYTSDMLIFRRQLEKETAEILQKHPDTVWSYPPEIPPREMSSTPGVARSSLPQRNEKAINQMLRPTADEKVEDDPFKDIPKASAGALVPVGQQGVARANGHDHGAETGTGVKGEVITFGPGKTSFGDSVSKTDKPVDYYIDIDFPPLEQKDATVWVDAMTKLNMLLPPNEESQKLVISMALNALGVNDVDQVVDQIMEAAEKEKKKNPQGMGGGMGGPPGMGGPMGGMGGGFQPRLPPGPQFLTPRRFGESEDVSERMARIIEVVGQAAAELERHDDGGDPNR
jgi:hypothetical protein